MATLFRHFLAIDAAIIAVALCARVDVPVPGSPVPQSLQTLAVVVVGAWLGPLRGAIALAAYVVIGAFGAPVFADGAAGPEVLSGPTAGYLVGFILAAAVMGLWADRCRAWHAAPLATRILSFTALALFAHALILGFGWFRLATIIGAGAAFTAGVAPFIVGGIAKSLAGAAIVLGVDAFIASNRPVGHPEE